MNHALVFILGLLLVVFGGVVAFSYPVVGLAMVIPVFVGVGLMICSWRWHNTVYIYGNFGAGQ